jgi:hypothetical protein
VMYIKESLLCASEEKGSWQVSEGDVEVKEDFQYVTQLISYCLVSRLVRHDLIALSALAKHLLQVIDNDIWPFPRGKVPTLLIITLMYHRT